MQPKQNPGDKNVKNPEAPQSAMKQTAAPETQSDKGFIVTFLLSWLLGSLGADRFYLGKIGTGILKLVTFGGLGIWFIIDLINLAFGRLRAKDNRPLQGYENNKTWVRILVLIQAGLFVLVVFGILASLVFSTSAGIQQKARDTERKTDINSLQGQLEVYWASWADNATYPTLSNINDPTFRAASLKGLDPNALADPNNSSSQQLCAQSTFNCYGYTPAPANCDNGAAGNCTSYTLSAMLEAGGVYTKKSLSFK